MLRTLTLEHFVLVDRAHITLTPGLVVCTGETGAGKSILLDALHVITGGKAAKDMVRHGAEKSLIGAVFEPVSPGVASWLKAQDLPEEPSLTLRRTITKEGKSRAYINDVPVSLRVLQDLGQHLVQIHSQHGHHALQQGATPRLWVDAYAGAVQEVGEVRACWEAWQKTVRALEVSRKEMEQAEREQDYLQHAVAELELLAPKEKEESLLVEQRALLKQRSTIHEAITLVDRALQGSPGVQEQLAEAERRLHKALSLYPARLQPVVEALDRASIEVAEAITGLEQAAQGLPGDSASLEQTEDRLFALQEAARKYRCQVAELPEKMEELSSRLKVTQGGKARIAELEARLQAEREAYVQASQALHQKRSKAAATLEEALKKELTPLKMQQASFTVQITPLEEEGWGPHGTDQVQFLLCTAPGTPPKPLHAIASGGEMARVMLALLTVLSDVQDVPTLVFDEIDTGIGGAVADAVGQRLQHLSQARQVLCVTHQPQVAGYGTHHLKVEKNLIAGEMFTQVEVLGGEDRKEEIARMLAGATISEEARQSAGKLLEEPCA